MPITPKFQIEQEDDFIIVRIHVPHIRVSAAEILAEGNEFSFYCKPYLLKLSFPGLFCEDEEGFSAKYDPSQDNGTLTVQLQKRTPGEHFADLDLVSKLFQKKKVGLLEERLDAEGGVEVLHSENFVDDDAEEEREQEEREGVARGLSLSNKHSYGFHGQYTNLLTNLREQMLEMLEIESPECVSPTERRARRIATENRLFDATRYLGDLFGAEDDDVYSAALAFEPWWIKQWTLFNAKEKQQKTAAKQTLREEAFGEIGGFSESERDTLASGLKQKEFLISAGSAEEKNLLLGLVDLLFAFCYDQRVTQGEENVESPHNIARLSVQLSWLDAFRSPDDDLGSVLRFNMRRMLVYPYLRVWKLGRKVLADVAKILLLGRRAVLKCLLQLRYVFEHTDTHYLLNKLFVDDYCVWLQTLSEETVVKLGVEYNLAKNALEKEPNNGKRLMGFFLDEIETWIVEQEPSEEDSIPEEYLNYDELIASTESLRYLRAVDREENEKDLFIAAQESAPKVVHNMASVSKAETKQKTAQEPSSPIITLTAKKPSTEEDDEHDPHTTTLDAALERQTIKAEMRASRGPLIQIISSTEFDKEEKESKEEEKPCVDERCSNTDEKLDTDLSKLNLK